MTTTRDKLVFDESDARDGKKSSRYSYLLAQYVKAWEAYRDVDSKLFLYDAENEGE